MKFNKLIPELEVNKLEESLDFYTSLGFKVEYSRPENKFAFLSLEGSQIMLQEGKDKISPSESFHFQIEVKSLKPIIRVLVNMKYPIKENEKDYWYRQDNKLLGMRAIFVKDPSGYTLMFFENLGSKKLS